MDSLQEAFIHPPELCEARFVMDVLYLTTFELLNKNTAYYHSNTYKSQVLIPAEHLWCDFKYRPWAKNSSPNTNDLYIHYMDKSTGTPSLEEKKHFQTGPTKMET